MVYISGNALGKIVSMSIWHYNTVIYILMALESHLSEYIKVKKQQLKNCYFTSYCNSKCFTSKRSTYTIEICMLFHSLIKL